MSYFTKPRTASYYNDLLTGSEDDFLKLVKRYSICPPSQIHNYRGKSMGSLLVNDDAAATPLLQNSTRSEDIKLARIPKAHKIAYINLKLEARGSGKPEGGDHIYFDCDYAAAHGHVPVYYLPWDDSGAAIRLTIPTKGVNHPDPDVFFTAAINGCSIFFQGTKDNPTIYHCGGSTGQGANVQNATDFWEDVIDEFLSTDTHAANKGALAPRSVNKREYITTPGVTATQLGPTGVATQGTITARSKRYRFNLKLKHKLGRLTVREVAPWACVLGHRDNAGDWIFYLQENATITYHEVERKLPNLFHAKISPIHSVSRPLLVREIFPQGDRHVTVRAGLPSIV